jgi:predicted MFS family arabinose efflux permease
VAKPYNLFGLFELDQPEQATSLFVIVSTVGSLLSSVVSGILSDRSGTAHASLFPAFTDLTSYHRLTHTRNHRTRTCAHNAQVGEVAKCGCTHQGWD